MRGSVLTRAHALRNTPITEIIDKRSSCARVSDVFTAVYRKPEEGPAVLRQIHGTVLVHPEIELIADATSGIPIWSNADLAVILLEEPVSLDFQPITLPASKVKLGDALVVVGYGPGASDAEFGSRQFGDNKVTLLVNYETGNVLFGAPVAPVPPCGAPAAARPGDSGGAGVTKENQNVLMGVVTMGTQTAFGIEISYFTSVYPYREWLLEIILRANLATDAGVSVPSSGAGVDARDSDAGSTPSLPPAAQQVGQESGRARGGR